MSIVIYKGDADTNNFQTTPYYADPNHPLNILYPPMKVTEAMRNSMSTLMKLHKEQEAKKAREASGADAS